MAKFSTCLDNSLELINKGTDVDGSFIGDRPEWNPVSVWLQLFRTFLILVLSWRNTNEVVRDRLGDVVISIENAFQTAADEIAESMKKGDADVLDTVRIKLLSKIEILTPRIRESYDFLTKHVLKQSATDHLPIADSDVWVKFCSSLVLASQFLSSPTLLRIEGIVACLQAFEQAYLTRGTVLSDCEQFRRLSSYLECVAISVAGLVFLWRADETNDQDKAVMLNSMELWKCSIMPEHTKEIVGMRMQEPADLAKTPRNVKRPKMSSLHFPSASFDASTHGQIIGEIPRFWTGVESSREVVSPCDTMKEENVFLKQRIKDLEESLSKEHFESQILRSEKASLEIEIERLGGI